MSSEYWQARIVTLLEAMLENDPNDMAADAVTLMDVWRRDAEGYLAWYRSDAPDRNCHTLSDGSCVGRGCMHDVK